MRNLERRETEYMRLQRRKIGIDDFEQLTVIGKGAFGEVHKHNQDNAISVVLTSINFTSQISLMYCLLVMNLIRLCITIS